MNSDDSGAAGSKHPSKTNRNLRPPTSTRATFALGQEAIEKADRLARIASNFKVGGVSRSAVLRGLLKFAEDAALHSGDEIVAGVIAQNDVPNVGNLPVLGVPKPEYARIWKSIRKAILES